MKYKNILSALLLTLVLLLSSCISQAGNVTTDFARNHIYNIGDPIRFLDENNDRKLLGTLIFTSLHIVSEEPFTQWEKIGSDENGEDIYGDVSYNQIVQINYTYETEGRVLEEHDFWVLDSDRNIGLINPIDVDFQTAPINDNEHSLIVALPNRSDTVRIEIRYSSMFHILVTPTAIATLSINDDVEIPTTSDSENDDKLISEQQENIYLRSKVDSLQTQLDNSRGLIFLLIVTTSVLIVLTIVFITLWINAIKRKKSK